MNDINTSFNGTSGVNPESDASHITLEYDTNSDKFYLDTGELTPIQVQNFQYWVHQRILLILHAISFARSTN